HRLLRAILPRVGCGIVPSASGIVVGCATQVLFVTVSNEVKLPSARRPCQHAHVSPLRLANPFLHVHYAALPKRGRRSLRRGRRGDVSEPQQQCHWHHEEKLHSVVHFTPFDKSFCRSARLASSPVSGQAEM